MAATQKLANRDWADDEDFDDPTALPAETRTKNKDGTETITSYKINDEGQRVKTTRRIRKTVVRETVNPEVASRRKWPKFGLEKGHADGPSTDTTTVGENILFRPSNTWKKDEKDETKKAEEETMKEQLRDKKVRCRICQGEHFTARCPYKDTMAPAGETAAPEDDAGAGGGGLDAEGGLGTKTGAYVPVHLRNGGKGAGERMGGGKYGDRDDLATLRVTNVSEFAEEQDLRDIFSRFGHVTRVFLAKDRETQRAKGFAFISFGDREDAARACAKLDGFGYENLILRVEFAKRPPG